MLFVPFFSNSKLFCLVHLKSTPMQFNRPGYLLLLIFFVGGISISKAQPVAEFTADTLTGCSQFPLVVNFEDQSTGNPVSWLWQFGDGGSTSSSQNPSFAYTGAGCYAVTLTVTDAQGRQNSRTKPCFIELFDQPTVDFTQSQTEGCSPLTVSFSDASSSPSGNITEWFWSFSNGAFDTVQNPTIVFDEAGTFNLVLTVTDENGCSSTSAFPNILEVYQAPDLDFSADAVASCSPPLTVNFTNTTQQNGAQNLSYIWQFPGGDPISSTAENPPSVTYDADGTYDVTLILSSANGCRDTLSRSGFIGIGGVTASMEASVQEVCAGDPVQFTNTSTGGVDNVQWDFGDGNTSNQRNPTHIYDSVGVYTVSLQANNPDGCGDMVTENNFIRVTERPQADFTVNLPPTCNLPATATFQDISTNAVSWEWDFGDGSPVSTDRNPSHTYTSYGDFEVSLVVTSPSGCSDTLSVPGAVSILQPVADFRGPGRQGCIPLTVTFQDSSTSAVDPIVSWQWDFDGANPATSTEQNPTVEFTDKGRYTISLIVETSSGCRDTLTRNNYVRAGTPPSGAITVTDSVVCVNEPLMFTSLLPALEDTSDWEFQWDFEYEEGDFTEMSTENDPGHVYQDTGTYSVALIIDNIGCEDTIIRENWIVVGPPRAQFTLSDQVICTLPSTVTITDESIGPADVYEWYLNDVLFSNNVTPPPLTIADTGAYIVKLIVENTATGCIDSALQAINAGNPVADFIASDTRGCRTLVVDFQNTSQNASSFFWLLDENGDRRSQLASPLISFPDTGFYTITLFAADVFGCVDTLVRTDHIEVIGPYAEYTPDPPTGCPPLPVQFNDFSVASGTSNLTGWQWDFGDPSSPDNTSTLQNPTHTFDTAGTYTITLIVTDTEGCTDTLMRPDVEVTFPELDFEVSDDSTCAGNVLTFNNLSQGTGLQFTWDFGDGSTSDQESPLHAYADTGSYTVRLVATDVNGCTDSLIRINYIYIESFSADFIGDPLVGICPPLNTAFTNLSEGNIATYSWDFGDGIGQSALVNPGYTYLDPGIYDVTLIATHEDGCTDERFRPEYVEIGGPIGEFIIDTLGVCLGSPINLTIVSDKACTLTIDYRDGTVEQRTASCVPGQIDTTRVSHLYQVVDAYSPVVLLQDATGCPFTIEVPDSIRVFPAPQADFGPVDTTGCVPFVVPFRDASVEGDAVISEYFWDFGDGVTANGANPMHVYTEINNYTVQLRVEDLNGCTDSAFTSVNATDGIIANFTASDTFSCAPLAITFTDLSFNGNPSSWFWDFGDGTSSTDRNPVHTYQQDGRYTVSLIVTDALGCEDTLVKQDYIYLRHPVAEAQSSLDFACAPVTLTFTSDNTLTDTLISKYQWCVTSLANGITDCITSNTDSVDYEFTEPGDYEMLVIVSDAVGCIDSSDVVPITISDRGVPEPLDIRYVTVLSDTSAELSFEPYPETDFVDYAIYRIDGNVPTLIANITDQNATLFVDSSPALDFSQQSYCYKVLVQNSCLEYSSLDDTQEHCTVELVTTPGVDEVMLDWSAYVGWPVDQYVIYRLDSNTYATNALVEIGRVDGSVTSFVDTATFCRDSITYRIQAVNSTLVNEISFSDISRDAPLHSEPDMPVDVIVATVENDAYIEIEWDQYTGYKPMTYLIEKSNTGTVWDSLASFGANSGIFNLVDSANVEVDKSSYFYRVTVIDSCGDSTPLGLIGKTILLRASLSLTNIPQLNWSAYEEWPSGVLNYEIQVLNNATGTFETVDIVPGTITRYSDERTTLNQEVYCYRILAYDASSRGAISVSNEDCVVFAPNLFVPNAFTPNGDGKNEVFTIFAPELRNPELSIYDRWGELLYRTLNIDEGWDGTYQGSPVPEGVYVFVITGVGFEGDLLTRSGTVTLIR